MIEEVLRNFLNDMLPVPVFMEYPKNPPYQFVVIEKEGSQQNNKLYSGLFAFQSYGKTLYDVATLNEKVKKAMEKSKWLDEIARVQLNSDYNYTDTGSKEYRYQAVYDINYYGDNPMDDLNAQKEAEETRRKLEEAQAKTTELQKQVEQLTPDEYYDHVLVSDQDVNDKNDVYYIFDKENNCFFLFTNHYYPLSLNIDQVQINDDLYDVKMPIKNLNDTYLQLYLEQPLKDYTIPYHIKIWISDHRERIALSTLKKLQGYEGYEDWLEVLMIGYYQINLINLKDVNTVWYLGKPYYISDMKLFQFDEVNPQETNQLGYRRYKVLIKIDGLKLDDETDQIYATLTKE